MCGVDRLRCRVRWGGGRGLSPSGDLPCSKGGIFTFIMGWHAAAHIASQAGEAGL